MKRKLLSILLSLAMVITMMPMATMTAFAFEKSHWSLLANAMAGQGEYFDEQTITDNADTPTNLFKVKDETTDGITTRTIKLLSDITATSADSALVVKSSADGGKITVLDLNGCALNRGLVKNEDSYSNDSGSVLVVEEDAVLTINDSTPGIEHFFTKSDDEYYIFDTQGEYVVKGGIITGGTGSDIDKSEKTSFMGGGILNKGTLTINSGSIVGNTPRDGGGGVAVYAVTKQATFTMNGGTICGNYVGNGMGGGIYAYPEGGDVQVTIKDGKICKNVAVAIGGIALHNENTEKIISFVMEGGVVSENKTKSSGIIAGSGVAFCLFDGEFQPVQEATVEGTFGGTAQIINNYHDNGQIDNLKLISGTKIRLGDGKSVSEPYGDFSVGVNALPAPFDSSVPIVDNGTADDLKYFTADAVDEYVFFNDNTEELELSKIPDGSNKIIVAKSENGKVIADKQIASENETVNLTVTPDSDYELDTLIVKDANGDDVKVINNQFTMPASAVTVTATFKAKETPTPTAYVPTNQELFNAYKTTAKAECDKLITGADSEVVKALVTDAKTAIDNTQYDSKKSLAENKAVVDSIVTKLNSDIEQVRTDEATTALVKAAKVSLTKATAYQNGKIKLTFKSLKLKDGVKVVNYQVYRSTSKKFNKNLKKANFKRTADTKNYTWTNVNKLKKGTKYYYKVRGRVQLSDGTYVYTKWSTVKSAKCKKSR